MIKGKGYRIVSILCLFLLVLCTGCEDFQNTDMGDGAPEETLENTQADEDITSSADGKKTLRYAIVKDPSNIDPQLASSSVEATIGFHVYEGLVKNNRGTVKNAMAKSYQISQDGLTYTFYLRDASWSDGKAVTAQHFVDGIERLMNPKVKSSYSYLADCIANVQATDEKTVVITLKEATPYFLNLLCMVNFSPVREDIIKKEGSSFAMRPSTTVYNGPFVVSAWKKGRKIILEKNKNYYNSDNISLDRVEIISVSNVEEAYKMYKSGDIDFVEVNQASYLADESNYNVDYDGGVEYLTFNFNNRYLQNKNLRLAISYAINRSSLLQESGQELNEIATRYIMPDIDGVTGKYGEEQKYTPFSAEENRTESLNYLASALNELKISDASEIKLELLVENTQVKKKEGECIKKQLETLLGIEVALKKSSKVKKVNSEAKGDFCMTLTTWYPDYADALSYIEIWESSSIYNISCYNNKLLDNKLGEIRETSASKARQRKISEAERMLCEDAALVPIQFSKKAILHSSSLTGLVTYYIGNNYNYIHANKTTQ